MKIKFVDEFLDGLKVAMETVAKNDVRSALNGLFFDFNNRRLMASDGHRAFIVALPEIEDDCESIVVAIKNPITGAQVRKLPNAWQNVTFDFDEMLVSGIAGQYKLEKIDQPYYDKGLIDILKGVIKVGPVEDIKTGTVLNPELLAGWKVGKFPAVGLTIAGENRSIIATFPNLTIDHIAIVMPMSYSPTDFRERVGTLIG